MIHAEKILTPIFEQYERHHIPKHAQVTAE